MLIRPTRTRRPLPREPSHSRATAAGTSWGAKERRGSAWLVAAAHAARRHRPALVMLTLVLLAPTCATIQPLGAQLAPAVGPSVQAWASSAGIVYCGGG